LQGKGVKIVRLTGAAREAFMACVYAVKRGDLGDGPRAEMRRLAATLVAAGAEAVIAGCTEVPLLLGAEDVSVPLVDSAEVLAQACVDRCR
ncbi:MAG: aspartate/glutamate racemase family protein, partial [Brevundimonas sp.]